MDNKIIDEMIEMLLKDLPSLSKQEQENLVIFVSQIAQLQHFCNEIKRVYGGAIPAYVYTVNVGDPRQTHS